MQNKPTVIIAGISSRPYVKAAVDAGYDVIAIDTFLDRDTRGMARSSFYVPCVDHQFHAQSMMEAISLAIEANGHQSLVGFSYGAGFEAQPELVTLIQRQLALLGNSANTVQQCKDPIEFVNFCNAHGFATPEIRLQPPSTEAGWLIKTKGASGGGHIAYAHQYSATLKPNQYFQKLHSGLPISCLFLATETSVSIIGVNEQWLASTPDRPFQYGGAVSYYPLSEKNHLDLTRFVTLSQSCFGLKGLNSVDALLDDNRLVFLEINPRLSATIDLYATQDGGLFESHVAAFQSRTVNLPKVLNQPKAHHIVYAKQITKTQAHQAWPDWVCDIPNQAQTFDVGMPICTVVSAADSAHAAKQLVKSRAASL